MSMLNDSVGARLRLVRQRFGLSQRDLARRAGMTNSTLSTIEQGKSSPSIASLEKLLTAVPITLKTFFSSTYDPTNRVIPREQWRHENSDSWLAETHKLTLARLDGLQLEQIKITSRGSEELSLRYGKTSYIAGRILSGSANFHQYDFVYELNEGDGFQFCMQDGLRAVNQKEDHCELFIVASGILSDLP